MTDFDSELLEAAARALYEKRYGRHDPPYALLDERCQSEAAAVLAVVVPLIEGRYEPEGYQWRNGERFAVFVHRSEENTP